MVKRIVLIFALAITFKAGNADSFEKTDKQASKIPGSATKSVQALTDYINTNFTSSDDRIRAAYIWITKNVGYDKNGQIDLTTSYPTDSAANVILKKKKGVCSDYAELFQKTCSALGFECYVVTGYTKIGGKVNDDGHAWNALKLEDGKWLLFDPMLGAGSLQKGKFSKKQNTEFFAVLPSEFIKTHMPFDPIWQLMDYPIKAEAFYSTNIEPGKTRYSYNDTIAAANKLFMSEQLEGLCRRLEWVGNVNNATGSMLDICKHNIEVLKKKEKYALEFRNITAFNGVVDHINVAISYYNKYKAGKKSAKGKAAANAKQKTLIDSCTSNIAGAQLILSKLKFEKEEQIKQKDGLSKTINDLQTQLDIETAALNKQKSGGKGKKGKK